LFALYVRSADQGRGIGKALMAAALGHERVVRAGRVTLDVWENNARALGLYRRFGFREVGRRDFTVDGHVLGEDIVMVRDAR
jgi:ribosomal protein S18 acetylase RimI-like enzyme